MENPIEIGRVRRSEQMEIVVRIGEFMGKSYVDIREYLIGPEPYEGFTKRGIRIPVDLFPKVLEKLQLI